LSKSEVRENQSTVVIFNIERDMCQVTKTNAVTQVKKKTGIISIGRDA